MKNRHIKGCNTERRGCMPGCDNYDPVFDSPTGLDERSQPAPNNEGVLEGPIEKADDHCGIYVWSDGHRHYYVPKSLLDETESQLTIERVEREEAERALSNTASMTQWKSLQADLTAERARSAALQAGVDALLDWVDEMHPNPGTRAYARRVMKDASKTALSQSAPNSPTVTMCGMGPNGSSCVCYGGERCNCRCHALAQPAPTEK